MKNLNPLSIPLNGRNFIEASAGTGKTYTIASLVLRCILYHLEKPISAGNPISIENILVVTFTNAATDELRQRIREKLIEAKSALISGSSKDPLVAQIIKNIDDPKLAWTALDHAICHMDIAHIYTIHGFCQKMLSDFAFDIKQSFDYDFSLDKDDAVIRALNDFWRQEIVPLPKHLLKALLKHSLVSNLPDFRQRLKNMLHYCDMRISPQTSANSITELSDSLVELSAEVKHVWLEQEMSSYLESICKKNRLQGKKQWLDYMNSFCQSDELIPLIGNKEEGWHVWSSAKVKTASNKDTLEKEALFQRLDRLAELESKWLKDLNAYLLQKGFKFTQDRLEEKSYEDNTLNPDDLLRRLHTALANKSEQRFAEKIQERFPIAFIDEFQDTDKIQYHIFDSIYGQLQARSALFFIGDPKQAIYSFRGADVNTYLNALKPIADEKRYTLGTNWRSSPEMIAACNTLFSYNSSLFDPNGTLMFHPVEASNRYASKSIAIRGKTLAALNLIERNVEKALTNKQRFQDFCAFDCAQTISELLCTGTVDNSYIKAKQIAVLVRDRNEAAAIKQALSELSINSVFLSKENVFSGPAAIDFLCLLQALANPSDERLVRRTLASTFFSFDDERLSKLLFDDSAYISIQQNLQNCYEIILSKGISATLFKLARLYDLPKQWLKLADAERYLSDLRHIAELLDEQRLKNVNIHQLIAWLQKQMTNVDSTPQHQLLRLETDASLVKIQTIHASKGLEYDFVFLPFISWSRPNSDPLYYDSESEQYVFDTTFSATSVAQAQQEQLAEDVRLLYVAVTRAKFACWLFLCDNKQFPSTALALALNWQDKQTLSECLHSFKTNHGCPHIQYDEIDAQGGSLQKIETTPEIYHVADFNGTINSTWNIHSYSSMVSNFSKSLSQHEHHSPISVEKKKALITESNLNSFNFPQGAHTGNLLHSILENIDFNAEKETIKAVTLERLMYYDDAIKKEISDEAIAATLADWLLEVLHSRLMGTTRLADISSEQRLIELEFHFPLTNVDLNAVNVLLHKYDYPQLALNHKIRFHGMLKGFIDLIVQFDSKLYIIDYKSNYLGGSADDYTQNKLDDAIKNNLYYFQYLIYSVAVYRFCESRMNEKNFSDVYGGVMYLFLRGMSPENPGCGVYYDKPDPALIASLSELFSHDCLA